MISWQRRARRAPGHKTEASKVTSTQQQVQVELHIPCDPRYIGIARLVTTGVGASAGLYVEVIDDLKVVVSEACTNVIEHAFADRDLTEGPAEVILRFRLRANALQIEVEDYGVGFDPEQIEQPQLGKPSFDGGLGLFLMRQLTDELEIQSAPGSGTKVIITRYLSE